MVEKVPDSTYEMVGGLDKQIKEIKEVIELPVKHPELFEALGIAQPKVSTHPTPAVFCLAESSAVGTMQTGEEGPASLQPLKLFSSFFYCCFFFFGQTVA